MRCIELRGFGGPEVLQASECPKPVPGAGEVLIEVHAAGVNRPDCLQRQGKYPPPPGASPLLGLEVAGIVAECGPGAALFKPGDRVCALVAGGGYAEYAAAPEVQCLPLPKGWDFAQAAALPETAFTVWTNVFEDGALAAGETLLVHGGSGGIGIMAVEMAHALGARVIATVGRAEGATFCRERGAGHAILYKEEDFAARARELTGGRGVDVVLDMVGGPYLPRNLEALAPRGRLIQIAVMGGSKAELDLHKMMMKRIRITGSTLRPRPPEEKGRIARELGKRVWPLLEAGRIRPQVTRRFPLEAAMEAHELMEAGGHLGKIVLEAR